MQVTVHPGRREILSFRASRAEASLIRTLAANRGLSVSDLLRNLAFTEARRALPAWLGIPAAE